MSKGRFCNSRKPSTPWWTSFGPLPRKSRGWRERPKSKGVTGPGKDLPDSVIWRASILTARVRNTAKVPTAVANGDLSRKITVDVKGEILQLKDTINTMVDQLRSFASEVTRVA